MEKSDFKARFRELYETSRCSSITQFAQKLEMNRQSVDRYYNGERCPDAPALAKICEKMDVSADWLLGLSDVKKSSADLRAVCEYTGMSDEAIQKIRGEQTQNPFGKLLSRMIETRRFYNLMTTFKIFTTFVDCLKEEDLYNYDQWGELSDKKVILNPSQAVRHFRHEVSSAMERLCGEIHSQKLNELRENVSPHELKVVTVDPTPFRFDDGEE